jgi:hypothetical protein
MRDPKQLPECLALDAHRLDKDWTFKQLGADMARAGIALSPRTLHYLIKRAPADSMPLDRTLYKIRKYLKLVAESEKRRRARSRRRPSAAQASASV